MGRDTDIEWLRDKIAPLLNTWNPSVIEGVLVELTVLWLNRLLPKERDEALRTHFMTIMKRHIAEPRLTVPEPRP
jgi:hypothetical protein